MHTSSHGMTKYNRFSKGISSRHDSKDATGRIRTYASEDIRFLVLPNNHSGTVALVATIRKIIFINNITLDIYLKILSYLKIFTL